MSGFDFSGITVLVCDDSFHIRQMVKNFLTGYGVREILEAGDAKSGFDCFVENDPDVVVTDWNMGETSGLDLVHLIRWSEKSPNTFAPVIMLTGFTELERVQDARDAGITSYLAKPLSAGVLYKRLCSVVEDDRPFVRDGDFFGPDRRMKQKSPLDFQCRRTVS
jgi:two-component system, chemotaxis family, chemotaxis protein CheY